MCLHGLCIQHDRVTLMCIPSSQQGLTPASLNHLTVELMIQCNVVLLMVLVVPSTIRFVPSNDSSTANSFDGREYNTNGVEKEFSSGESYCSLEGAL